MLSTGLERGPYGRLITIKYDANGNQLWKTGATAYEGQYQTVHVGGSAIDRVSNLYMVVNFGGNDSAGYVTFKYASNGTLVWPVSDPDAASNSDLATGLALGTDGNVCVTGESSYFAPNYGYATYLYGTYMSNSNGQWVWTNGFPQAPSQPSFATSFAVDFANNSYVTGYSPGTNSANDIVTIAYGPNGNQLWLQRYHGPGNGNDAGNAIAVDANGNVYVAGYDTTTAGGTEMVLLKYSPVTIQKRADGSILLQAQGAPGQSFDIQASTNLQSWLDLGTFLADTNGLLQYADTNASNLPSRFYHTNPQ